MKRSKTTRWLRRLLLLAVLGTGVGYGRWYWQNGQAHEATHFETEKVTRGDLLQTISAAGTLNPVTKVDVSSQISGNIQKLFVDFNSPVKEGQVLAQLDAATYEANVAIAEGNLASARSAFELARLEEQRASILRSNSLNAQAEYDLARAELRKAEASVKISEGQLRKNQVDLARCTIYSPIDGLVIYRTVNVGQTVAASLSAPTLMIIANDLSKMQIEANVVEADIGRVQVGQDVEFRVDAYLGEKFKGKVTQVRNAPREEMNVVAYQTIIEVSNKEHKLKPGMTANVAIIVASREDVLKLPNSALRFKPPKETVILEPDTVATTAAGGSKEASAPKEKKSKSKSGRKVYVVSGKPSPEGGAVLRTIEVKNGITDGISTEMLEGLKEGDEVVTGIVKEKDRSKSNFNPFAWIR
jgi:HlyD family secretion protein